jgi:methionine-gamma-lyase
MQFYSKMINPEYGFGGMMTLRRRFLGQANALMELMNPFQGYLCSSLDFTKPCLARPEPQLQKRFR